MSPDKVTTVNVNLTVLNVDVNEVKSSATMHGWIAMSWNDDKLKWDPRNYENVSVVHMADHEVWKPDLVLYNMAIGPSVDHYGHTNCIVYSEGCVLWVPPHKFNVYCNLNLKYWPFDEQMCFVKLGSWTYNGYQIDLKVKNAEVSRIFFYFPKRF